MCHHNDHNNDHYTLPKVDGTNRSSSTIRMRIVANILVFLIHYQWIFNYIGIIIGLAMLLLLITIPLHENIPIPVNTLSVICTITVLLLILRATVSRYCSPPFIGEPHVLCIDHAQFDPPSSWKVSHDDILTIARAQGCYTEDSIHFMSRLLHKSGTSASRSTAYPPAVVKSITTNTPADASAANTREEAREVIITTVKKLLKATNIHPKSIDYVIVNCTMYTPVPSHAAMIVNELDMRSDVITYNISGMGCSAGIISIDLARRLLRESPGRALVVSAEILTRCFYRGNDREPLMGNTLFRCGGSAALLTSLPQDYAKAKYKLLHCIRTQVIGKESFESIIETDDSSKKIVTLRLQKSIIKVAGMAIQHNLTKLAPLILPYREVFKVLWSMLKVKCLKWWSKNTNDTTTTAATIKMYVPDLRKGVDHWCIHTGGRGVLDAVQSNLKLSDYDIAPSRNILYERGNTSSSSIWYELAWAQRDGRIKRGDRILQMAFGSGFKCNSCIWVALHDIIIDKTHDKTSPTASEEA
ncbi:inositol polyphosphate kinase kcs1 [Perkinsus olseni]|uniref:3-ketoacyl-CoA synthase n=1 Tax=Perkinsus olseni TaxID=32597 RepID=A0A7J6T6F7_PEROL|nr:inositol polyphosphate kinase kcs1 [Perkinsus olseni]